MVCEKCGNATSAYRAGLITKEEAQLEHDKCSLKNRTFCFCQHKLDAKVIVINQPFRDPLELPQQNALDSKLSA